MESEKLVTVMVWNFLLVEKRAAGAGVVFMDLRTYRIFAVNWSHSAARTTTIKFGLNQNRYHTDKYCA